MIDNETVRALALALPGVAAEGTGFGVDGKGFAWYWNERVVEKQPKVPNLRVLAVRTANLDEKDALLELNPAIFFTEPHYRGYPAVLVRLDAIDAEYLAELLESGWRTKAKRAAVKALDASRAS